MSAETHDSLSVCVCVWRRRLFFHVACVGGPEVKEREHTCLAATLWGYFTTLQSIKQDRLDITICPPTQWIYSVQYEDTLSVQLMHRKVKICSFRIKSQMTCISTYLSGPLCWFWSHSPTSFSHSLHKRNVQIQIRLFLKLVFFLMHLWVK